MICTRRGEVSSGIRSAAEHVSSERTEVFALRATLAEVAQRTLDLQYWPSRVAS